MPLTVTCQRKVSASPEQVSGSTDKDDAAASAGKNKTKKKDKRKKKDKDKKKEKKKKKKDKTQSSTEPTTPKRKQPDGGASDAESSTASKSRKIGGEAKVDDEGNISWESDGVEKSAQIMSVLGNELKVWVEKDGKARDGKPADAQLYWTDRTKYHSKPVLRGDILGCEVVQVGFDQWVAVTTSETPHNAPIVFEACSFHGFWTSKKAIHIWSPLPKSPGANDEAENSVDCDGETSFTADLHFPCNSRRGLVGRIPCVYAVYCPGIVAFLSAWMVSQ
jgi:hypothetical protein